MITIPTEAIRFLRVKDLPALELYQANDVTRFVPRHIHWVFSLTVAEAGVHIHETKQGKYYVTPGTIVIVNVGDTHHGSVPDGYNYSSRSVRINTVLLSKLIMQVTGQQQDTINLGQPLINDLELAQKILNLHRVLGKCSTSALEKECLMLDVFAQIYDHHSREKIKPLTIGDEHIMVSRVCEYLQDCFNENVSLDKLAAIVGLSSFHLSRVFAKETGVPPHAYQLQIRLKRATDLLSMGKPIVDVALETGFCDQSHFQKAFKKKFGITPRQYEW